MAQSKLTSFFSSARKKGNDDESDDETPGPSTEKKNSRPQGFAENWLKKCDWLFVENGGMKCDPCIKTKQPFYHREWLHEFPEFNPCPSSKYQQSC